MTSPSAEKNNQSSWLKIEDHRFQGVPRSLESKYDQSKHRKVNHKPFKMLRNITEVHNKEEKENGQ
jgi:hypothetical protein